MTTQLRDRLFDVRPDRLDLRDREYLPRLRSLPDVYPSPESTQLYLPRYEQMILDQGREGACTGFGMACVVNFLLWTRRWRDRAMGGVHPDPDDLEPIECVSPRMLYHLARFYDEWPGEDYEGSSCRGAMKGWHRHGVCSDRLWPYRDRRGVRFIEPDPGWQQDAASRSLGAYYRVNRDSVSDLQAAIFEVGVVYVSARVHDGWSIGRAEELPILDPHHLDRGGHAFALIGYTRDGFIVQNSWGPDWGFHGFAVLTYRDWVARGMDAWVAVLGATVNVQQHSSSDTFRRQPLGVTTENGRTGLWFFGKKKEPYEYENLEVQPWSEAKAYRHSLVMGNDGRPISRLVTSEHAEAAATAVCHDFPAKWIEDSHEAPKMVVYGHGGLNSEEDAIARTRILAPYFEANGIYPIFLCWKTGFGETVDHIFADKGWSLFSESMRPTTQDSLGISLDNWRKKFADAKDRTIEVGCEKVIKPIWSQMKQNAAASAGAGRGIYVLAECLKKLKREVPELEVHLVGHSAGSIILGHLLDLCDAEQLPLDSVAMFAPACTVRFALEHYAPAIKNRVVKSRKLYFENLTDDRELEDSIGPYGKSLLYLVSRALEQTHKTPILGMTRAWEDNPSGFSDEGTADISQWRGFWRRKRGKAPKLTGAAQVSDGQGMIPSAHGSFDNDVEVITRTIQRVCGSRLTYPVESLRGF